MNPEARQEEEDFFDRTTAYVRFRTIREERVDDKLFLIDRDESAIHMLEPTASAVWFMLAQPCRVEDVVDTFVGIFPDMDREKIDDDIEALFAELEGFRLIGPDSEPEHEAED